MCIVYGCNSVCDYVRGFYLCIVKLLATTSDTSSSLPVQGLCGVFFYDCLFVVWIIIVVGWLLTVVGIPHQSNWDVLYFNGHITVRFDEAYFHLNTATHLNYVVIFLMDDCEWFSVQKQVSGFLVVGISLWKLSLCVVCFANFGCCNFTESGDVCVTHIIGCLSQLLIICL